MKANLTRYILKTGVEYTYCGAGHTLTTIQHRFFTEQTNQYNINTPDYNEKDLEKYLQTNDIDDDSNISKTGFGTDEHSYKNIPSLNELLDKLLKKYQCHSLRDLVNYVSGNNFLIKYEGANQSKYISKDDRKYIDVEARRKIVQKEYANDSDISLLFAELMSSLIGRAGTNCRSINQLITDPLNRVSDYFVKESKGKRSNFYTDEELSRQNKDRGIMPFSFFVDRETGLMSSEVDSASAIQDIYDLPDGWFETSALESSQNYALNLAHWDQTKMALLSEVYDNTDYEDFEHKIILAYLREGAKTQKEAAEKVGLAKSKFETQLAHIEERCGVTRSRRRRNDPKKDKKTKKQEAVFSFKEYRNSAYILEQSKERYEKECGEVRTRQATPEELEKYRAMIKKKKIFF